MDGFDINISQCPPTEWLPPNVSVYELDCVSPIPPHLIGQYDVVHVQLFHLGVRDRDPEVIAQNWINLLSKII